MILSCRTILDFNFSLLTRCFELLMCLRTVFFLTARVSQQTEQKSLPNDTIRCSLGNSFILVAGRAIILLFSALLPEDIFFPFGGLDFCFLASLETLACPTELKLDSSLCSQTETHTQI